MKKTLVFALAAAMLLAGTGLPAAASPTVFFSAVDYTLLPLDEAYMPLSFGGNIYAPVSVYTSSATGLFSSVRDDGRFVSLFGPGNKRLTFDLEAGVANDGDAHQYAYSAARLNGLYYLPVESVCTFFGLSFAFLDTEYGPLLRLRVKSGESTDQNFLSAARDRLIELYTAYIGPPATAAATTGGAAATDAATPAAPASSPPPTPPPSRPIAYLTFDDGPTHLYSDPILDILDQFGVKATFFLLGGNMSNNEPAVRRMLASGHAVGLHGWTHDKYLVYASAGALVEELERTNDKLEELTLYRSRLVRVPYGSGGNKYFTEDMPQAMSDAGYRFWDWNVDGDRSSRKSAGQISAGVIEDLEKHDFDGPAIILLHERGVTAEALPAILDYMTRKNYLFAVCSQNEPPFNRWTWIN